MEINAETFRVRRDGLNMILERRVTRVKKDTGIEYQDWENAGYYGKWEHIINHLINSEIKTPKGSNLIEQLPELLVELKRVEAAILEEIKTINPITKE